MLSKILSLAQEMISIKSTPDNPTALKEILTLALSNLKKFTIEKFESNGCKSALIYKSNNRPRKFKIILNGHLDIIPGKKDQYLPKIKGNKLYGAGAMDMKANVACFIAVFNEIANKINYPLGLQLVTDEEIGGFNGTKYQIEQGVCADFVIAGEPTNFDIINKAKGILWVKITSRGKSAHGAYPWKGKNAIWEMNKFLNSLFKKYPIPKKEQMTTTINLSKIKTSNSAFNKIPDDCEIWLDIRYASEDLNNIVNTIKSLLPKDFTFEIVVNEPALSTNKNNYYIKQLKETAQKIIQKEIIIRSANGSSDARHYMRVNCPGIEFGPIGGGIGSDNEWVNIKSLEQYYKIIKEFLLKL